MPKLNVDEIKQLGEPIEITLEGKTYTIEKVSMGLIDEVVKGNKSNELDAPVKQLALLLNVKPKELADVDIRKISKALKFIADCISKGIEDPK